VQTYHEELLEKSPRREFLNKYAVQLLVRYPNLKDQVNLRMQRLNSQWQVVEAAIAPHRKRLETQVMLQGKFRSFTVFHGIIFHLLKPTASFD
jgi:hypothetical protein